MKTILFISLLFLALCYDKNKTVSEDDKGPAYNYRHGDSHLHCYELFAYQQYNLTTFTKLDEPYWLDDHKEERETIPQSVADCVDSLLYDPFKKKYFDRCCYIRLQKEGKTHTGCILLMEENYLDTTETMRRINNGDKRLWTSDTKNTKVFAIDCSSSYIKFLSVATILLALIF